MRSLALGVLATLTICIADARPASADWRDAILGPSFFRAEAEREAAGSENRAREARVGQSDDDDERIKRAGRKKNTGRYHYDAGSGGNSGLASYYWQPQRVASGGWFNPNAMTAAHKTLPFGTRVRVTNTRNGRSVDVVINDRGPFVKGRVIDLSAAAAGVISMKGAGVAPVRLTIMGR